MSEVILTIAAGVLGLVVISTLATMYFTTKRRAIGNRLKLGKKAS
jgi:hypothetical protein